MNQPSEYEIRRDALMAAAASSQGESTETLIKVANQLYDWLLSAARASKSRSPELTLGSDPDADIDAILKFERSLDDHQGPEFAISDPVDVWTGDKHCEACGHLRSVHSGGSCYAVLGKGVCGCNKPKWASV